MSLAPPEGASRHPSPPPRRRAQWGAGLSRDRPIFEEIFQSVQQLLRGSLRAALLKDDLSFRVEKRDDGRVIEAALPIGAIGDAQRGGELAHGVLVGPEQRPALGIEPVALRVELQALRRVRFAVEAEER